MPIRKLHSAFLSVSVCNKGRDGERQMEGKKCFYQISPEATAHHLHSQRHWDESCPRSSSMILSDCSLSFCLPGTQMRRCIKSPLNLRRLCLSFFFSFSFSVVPFYQMTQGSGASHSHKTIHANAHNKSRDKRHVHTLVRACACTHVGWSYHLRSLRPR